MSDSAPEAPANRLSELRRGLRAVVRFCLGVRPERPPKTPPRPVRHPIKDLAEKLGPYPTQD
jgi:hypothetical protein